MRIEHITWLEKLDKSDRYFRCEACGRRILIRRGRLDMFNPQTSPLPDAIAHAFDAHSKNHATYDFTCPDCATPYRLCFTNYERGMGGPWYALVHYALRGVDEDGG